MGEKNDKLERERERVSINEKESLYQCLLSTLTYCAVPERQWRKLLVAFEYRMGTIRWEEM